MDQSAYGPLRIRVSPAWIRPLRIELVLFSTLSLFTSRCSDLCTIQPGLADDISGTSAINLRALTLRGPEVTEHIEHYKCLHTNFFYTKLATQLVFSLASLPSSTGPQAAAQTETNPADTRTTYLFV
jgi:hypothetical protein